MRLKLSGKLLGHGLVDSSVKVESGVHADGLDLLQSLNGSVEVCRRRQPPELSNNVHESQFLRENREGLQLTDSEPFILTVVNPSALRFLAWARMS